MELPRIWVEDVTENPVLADVAVWLCALSYSRLYGTDDESHSIRPYQTYTDFCGVELRKPRILMAFGLFKNSDKAEVLGTGALRLGCEVLENGQPNLEFTELFTPSDGWENHIAAGFNPRIIVEASRFAYAPRCLKKESATELLRIEVCRHLIAAGTVIGLSRGCQQTWAILPRHVAIFLKHRCGISIHLAKDLHLNTESYGAMFRRYDVYWERCKPALYQLAAPASSCSNPISGEEVYIRTPETALPEE